MNSAGGLPAEDRGRSTLGGLRLGSPGLLADDLAQRLGASEDPVEINATAQDVGKGVRVQNAEEGLSRLVQDAWERAGRGDDAGAEHLAERRAEGHAGGRADRSE